MLYAQFGAPVILFLSSVSSQGNFCNVYTLIFIQLSKKIKISHPFQTSRQAVDHNKAVPKRESDGTIPSHQQHDHRDFSRIATTLFSYNPRIQFLFSPILTCQVSFSTFPNLLSRSHMASPVLDKAHIKGIVHAIDPFHKKGEMTNHSSVG